MRERKSELSIGKGKGEELTSSRTLFLPKDPPATVPSAWLPDGPRTLKVKAAPLMVDPLSVGPHPRCVPGVVFRQARS
jgi:hypothetical protein